jgi:hypothetical protein
MAAVESWNMSWMSAAARPAPGLREAREVLAAEAHRSGRRVLQARDDPAERRLAAAGLADDAEGGPPRGRGTAPYLSATGRRPNAGPVGENKSIASFGKQFFVPKVWPSWFG